PPLLVPPRHAPPGSGDPRLRRTPARPRLLLPPRARPRRVRRLLRGARGRGVDDGVLLGPPPGRGRHRAVRRRAPAGVPARVPEARRHHRPRRLPRPPPLPVLAPRKRAAVG